MRPPRLRLLAYCTCALLIGGSSVRAQSIWVGGGTNGDWSQASNWTALPSSSPTTALLFATNNQINTNENIANPFILNSLGFDTSAGAFVINSGALQFQANGATAPSVFTNTSATTTFNSPVTFSATGSIGGTGTGTGAIAFGSLTAGTGTLTVNHTGVTATSLTVASGATIAPASSSSTIGTLTLGSASISGSYAADIGTGTTSDLLSISGALTLGAASTLTISGTASGITYTLATYGSHAGTFATVQNLPTGYALQYGNTSLQLVAIPEPAMILAMCAAGAGIVTWRRRVDRSRRAVIA